MWLGMLEEAGAAAMRSVAAPGQNCFTVASTILLSHSSIEMYLHELIASRRLRNALRQMRFPGKVKQILSSLDPMNFHQALLDTMLLVADLRNVIIHHDAKPQSDNHGPRSVAHRLETRGIIPPSINSTRWEHRILVPPVALWVVTTAADSILKLECLPLNRYRNFSEVFSAIHRITLSLSPSFGD